MEILIEQGKVTIVEIKRKMRMKETDTDKKWHWDKGSGKSNGTVSAKRS